MPNALKAHCPNCDKEVLTYNPRKADFCSLRCKVNMKFKTRFKPGFGPQER